MYRRGFIRSTTWFTLSLATAKLLSSCSSNPQINSVANNIIDLDENIKELNFGIISTESQVNQRPFWDPLIQDLSDALKMPVNASYVTSYAAVIESMRFGKVHMAWFGGKSYIEAAKMANAEAFAQTLSDSGSPGYYAHLITSKNNPIASQIKNGNGDQYVIENASDLTFAFNDPNSTSGFLVPSYYIFAKNNINPKEAFKQVIFSGSHEANTLAVVNNQVDVATTNSEALSRLEIINPEAREQIQIIWTSVKLPGEPIAYRKDLPEELKENIRGFFYNYNDKVVLEKLNWSGFRAAEDRDWNSIRELEIGRQILEIENNENINPNQKAKKIQELQKQLELL